MGKQKPKALFDYTDTTPDTTPKKDLLDFTMSNTRSKETPLHASGYETFQGDSDYDQSLGHGMSQSYNRAVNQPWYDELGNALGRTALNIIPSTISQLAITLDFEDYLNQDNEFGNEISRAMEELKQSVNQDLLPIYRKNPGEALNISDSAWWFENGGNLLESAGSFVATGGIISKGLQMLPRLAKIGALAKNISPEKLELLTKVGQTVATAFTLNQAEGGLSGMQVYDTVYQELLSEGIEDQEAKQRAADAAAYTVNINRANIPLNLTSSMAFLRGSKMSRGLLQSINSGKKVAGEALQEGAEEIVNLIGEREGIRSGTESNYEYDFDKTISDVFSAEGLEAFSLGAVGGAVQTGGQSILNRKQTGEHNQRVQEQQDYYTKLNDALKSTSTPDLFSFLQSAKDQGILQKKIDQADLKGDVKVATELRNNLAEIQAFHAFENSAADKLEDTYKQIAQYSPEEAGKKGLDINPQSKDYYKLKAHETVSKIKELEKTYNTLATRVPKEILKPAYLHNLENEKIRKEIRENDTEIVKEQQKSFEEITAGLDLHETSNYDYLGELTTKKEALGTKLKESVLNFKDIVNGIVKEKQNDIPTTNPVDTKVPKSPEQQLKDKESKKLVKEFQDAVFESEEDIQKAVYELPEELRKNKTVKDAVRLKEQRIAYKQLFAEGEKVEITKNGKKVQAVVIPEMYRLANSIVPTHISISENGIISTITPDNKKDTKTKIEDADPVVEENIPEPDEFIPDTDIPEPDDVNFLDNDDSLNSSKTDKTKERKTKTSEKRKQEQQIVTELKNTEKSIQLTVSNENNELTNELVQKIGYDYSRLNNPNNLNGEVRLSIEYIVYKAGGNPVATIIVEEQNEKGEWVKVTKLLKNYSGISDDLIKEFQNQFDAIEKYIKTNGSIITTVTDKQLYNYLNIQTTQSGIELLLTNDRAKNHLPDGEIYIGTVQGGVEKVRTIENDGKGGSVAIGKYPQEGRHFVVIKTSNGTLVPVYLQDSKLKDIEVGGKKLIEDVIERIETIKQEFLQSDLPKDQKSLNDFWYNKQKTIRPIVDLFRIKGDNTFTIKLFLEENGTIRTYHAESKKGELSEQQVYDLIGERYPNIQVDKLISDPEYTKYLVKNRFLTTDLNTERPVINTQLKVDVSFLTKPERLRATDQTTITPEKVTIQTEETTITEEEKKLLEEYEKETGVVNDPTKVNNLRTRLVQKRDYKQIDLNEELEWIKTNLPQIPVKVIQSTLAIAKKFGVEAHGIFTNAMIYIAENGATGTGYHEAFHAVFNLYLTPEQKETILNEASKKYGIKRSYTSTNEARYEEKLADEFAEYVLTDGKIAPSNAVSKFFKDIYLWLKDLVGLRTLEDLFYQINTGKFANSPIKNSRFNSNIIFTQKKDGVDFVFEQNSELSSIGNEIEYSAYLDSVFPNSKVKDIVYRGGLKDTDIKYSETVGKYGTGIYLSNNKDYSTLFSKDLKEDGKLYTALLNVESIEYFKYSDGYVQEAAKHFNIKYVSEITNDVLKDYSKYLQNQGKTIVVGKDRKEFVAFDSSQVHILGSKQDIEGFKSWKENNPSSTPKFKVVEGFNALEQKQRVESLLFEVFKGLQKLQNKGSLISIDPDNITPEMYNDIWSKIEQVWKIKNKIEKEELPKIARQKVLDNWNEFKELTTKELKRFGIKAVEREEDEKVGEDTKERIYDVAFFKSNIKDTLSTEMKLFVATIPVVKVLPDGSFENDPDELGNPKFVDRHKVYSDLSRELADILSIEGMISKIEFLANSNPQWYYISDFLKRTNSIVETEGVISNNFRNKFYSTFRKHNNKFVTIKKFLNDAGDVIYSITDTNKRGLDKQIIGRWKDSNEQIKSSDVYTPFAQEVRKFATQLNDKENKESLKIVEKHLKNIGIDLSLPTLENHREAYFKNKNVQPYTNYLLEKNKASVGQILNAFSEGKNIFGGEDGVGELTAIKNLAKFEAQVSTDTTNGAFLNGEDEMVYPINLPSFATNRITELKENVDNILQRLIAVPYLKNSRIINGLINDQDFKNQFDIGVFDTINDGTKKKQFNIPYSESQDFEFVISKIHTFFNGKLESKYGWFFPPTPSDKGNITPVKLPKLNIISTPLFINKKLNPDSEFTKWLYDAVEDEFNRIKQTWDSIKTIPEDKQILNYHYKIDKDGNRLLGNAFYFNQFHMLNELIYEDVNNPELSISNINELDQTLLLETLSTKFLTLITNEREQLVEKGVLSKTANTYNRVKGVLDSRIGDLKIFTDSYIINQFYANYELSNLFSGDMAFSKGNPLTPEGRKIQFADYNKRFGESFVPGTELGHSKEFSDVVKSTFRVEIANDIEISNPELSKVSKKYLKNNQTDAQGFITLERQREIMIGEGTFNEKYKKAWDRVRKGGTDIRDVSTVFQPRKGFYFSQDINEYGILVPTQVKYSSVPLIPALINNYPELKALNERMVNESIDEYVFESGIKKGRTQNSIIELQNKNWRQPQVVPYKDSTEERFGSQKRKLVTENIDESDIFEGRNLKEYYQELIAKNIEEDFKLVAPELANINIVAKTLLEQLVENNTKGLPDKFEKAMEVIEGKYGKDTRMSLDHPLIKKRVESIFNSFIDSRVVDQKLPGFSAVQVSTFGQVKVASDLKFIRKEGDKVEAAQVKVTPKYFIKMLKKQGVDITPFIKNGNIDITKIDKSLLKGTLHRIPTQGKNSMLPFEIVEFTPNEMGSVIFLPVEITTQMGSDFDIDKVYIETYNFEVVNGKLQKVKGDTTKEGRQNKIVDIHYNILTNPKYFDEIVTPNNSDTLISIKKEVLAFEEERGDNQQLEEFWFSPWLQEEFKKRNQAGKQLVGFYSIVSTAHSIAQDIKMKLKDGFTVNFNGKELNDLSKVKDISGTRISDNIAERQTAAVDNAKDPILGYLNDNLFTAPVKALLLRVGLPLRHTDYFTCQPIIVDLTKAFFKNSSGMSNERALQKAVTEVVKKYSITDKLITITGDKIQPANFNLESLKDGLKGKGDYKAILEAFFYYEKLGKSLYTVSLGLSPDRKGTASTMSENLYNQEKIKDAKDNSYITFDTESYNKHSLAAFEKYGIDEAIKIASGYYNKENDLGHKIIYFSDGTEVFRAVMDNIGSIKGESLTVKERQDITYQFYTYLHTGSELLKISNAEKLKIFTGSTSVVNRLRRYKTAKAEGKEDNLMLNNLNIVKDKDTGFETLEFNATANPALSPEEKQIFEDSILELYRAGGAKKTFTVDLLKYCFITNGFSRGTNTFIDYFPIEMFEETGLNEYYRDIKQNFDSFENNDFNIERFTDQYIQNNFDSLYWIPQYSNKTVKENLEKDSPEYYYNRTIKKLFKNDGEKTYIEINKLGRKNFIKEYDIDSDLSSIISTNNKSGKSQVESQQQEIAKDQLINTLDKLSKRFGIEYVIDNTMTVLGRYSNGKVFINPNLAKSDTPFHEFAHPFVECIKKNNPILYKNLVKQITTTAEGIQILNKVKRLYPVGKDYTKEDQLEEAIVTAIGQYGAKQIKDKSLVGAIKMLLKRIARYVQDIITIRKDLVPEELNPNMSLEDLGRMVSGEDKIVVSVNKESNKEQKLEEKEKSKFTKQTEFFRKRIYTLEQEIKKHKPKSAEYIKRQSYINTIKEKLAEAIENGNKDLLKELGEETLTKAEEFITELEKGTSKDKARNIIYAEDVIHTWTDFGGLRDRSAELYDRLLPFIEKFSEERINAFATEGRVITKKDINSQTEDIGTFTKSVGALADLANYIGRTIGSIIKAAQNKVSTQGKILKDEIEKEIEGLSSYAKKKGITLDKVYDILIQERKGTLILAKKHLENGDINPNWETIQNNPELKKFYTYYQTTIEKFENSLPIKMGKYFIPNIKKDSVKDTLKSLNPLKERKVGKEIEEELISDVVPIKYYKKMNTDEKSRNLGESLLEFGKMTFNHNEMSKILPEVRLLQRQLTFKLDSNGEVTERLFGKSSNSSIKISGDKTNLYKMVDTIIEMQVKGVMKQEEGKFKVSTIYDEQGNPVKEKYIDVTGTLDNLIKWNSLLRIGLSPITALTNVTFGDISNVIEAVGGRFFGFNDLRKATNIFIKQTMNDGSVLNQLLLELNPLQELDDYEMISDSTVKGKMSKEKLQEYMYSLQKAGEKFLQSRTMIAIMIRDGYLNSSGVKTQEYIDLTEQQKEQLVDKIQRVNQMIHGRYTQREAAALQQSVIFRLVSQFRKWIPAAIESRIGTKQYDNRLQVEIEGRYRTIGRVVGKELFRGNIAQAFENLLLPLVSYKKALEKGNLTEMEIYNMRKNLTEIILTASTLLLFGFVKGDDDDDEWRKNPYVKTGLTLLNRVSGDLLFFMNPESGIQMTKNIAPITKLVDDLYKAVTYVPYAFYIEGSQFKTGSRKGLNKFYSKSGNLLPGVKPVLDVIRMTNKEELEELR